MDRHQIRSGVIHKEKLKLKLKPRSEHKQKTQAEMNQNIDNLTPSKKEFYLDLKDHSKKTNEVFKEIKFRRRFSRYLRYDEFRKLFSSYELHFFLKKKNKKCSNSYTYDILCLYYCRFLRVRSAPCEESSEEWARNRMNYMKNEKQTAQKLPLKLMETEEALNYFILN